MSEEDNVALYDYSVGLLLGRIKKVEVEEVAARQKNYEWYKKKMDSDAKGTMWEVSQFAMTSPELYRQYKERYDKEQDEERALHNRRLTENTFKNKLYSLR